MSGLDSDNLQLELADEPAVAVGLLIRDALAAGLLGESVERAAGHDTHLGGEELKHYWVYGEGATKWSTYTELHEHLLEHKVPHADAVAASWFHLRYGIWPGSDENRVRHGHPPRGHRVGPG